MAKGFNLTAELNLRGPNNLRTVVSNIKKQVGSISANITPTLNKSNIRTIATDIRSQLGNISIPLNVTVSKTAVQNISRDIRNRLSGIDIPVSVRVNRSSLSTARRDITRQLGNVNANVNITISPTATRNAAGLNRNLTVLNQSLNQTTTSATNAAAAIQSFAAAMRAAAGTNIPRNINIGLNTAGANATNAAASVRQLGGEVENFGRQAGLAIRRFAAFTTVTSVFYGLARSIQSGIAAFVDFDRELVRISQVTGDNIRDVNKLASTVTNLATTYGVSSRELAGVSLTLAQAGLTAKETERALKALALSALAPSFDDLNSTVEGSIALMRQFGISTNQLEGALGSINSVAAKFAVEASDIIAAIQRTGGVFAAASKGVSEGTDALNEFVAVFTSIRATTRESAETIATGLRTIFTRIQRGGTIEALKQFGVNLTDVEGKFVGAYKAVQLLSEGLTRLDPRDLRFSQIVEELGGFRQIGKVIPLIQEFATAQEALKVAQAGSGSLAEDAAKGQLALAVQISKVREEFLGLIRSVGDTSSFRTLVKLGLDLASSLIQVADAAKELVPLIGIFTAIRGAQALTRFGAGFIGGVRGAPTRGFASGGYVPGVGNSDTVPAMLTPGEFVIRKKAVEKIGVSRLARLNRNSGGSVPTQYFENGGPVQRFAGGKFVMPKARGSRGARGARGPKGFQPLSSEEYAKWSKQIYSQWENDPSLPMDRYMGIPMPKPIAEYQRKTRKYALESGGAGLALGRDAKGREVIAKFGKAKETEEKLGKLKKTPLGLIFSAAGLRRGPRAPAGQMEKVMAGYQGSSEFQKETSGAGSSLFAQLKGPLSSFKKGGTFGGVITPGSENATKIKGALGKLLSQSSGQDAVKAKTALDKFDSFIAGGTPEKPGHVAHFTWAMNQIFKKGIATFGRGGAASRRMGVFDFDMTTGVTKQKETPSLSGFRNPALAVPDILSATPTGLVELMKKYGAAQILTARSGGPKGEMRTALGSFFKRNGVLLPSSRITTLGDQVGSLSTAEKKARALHAMVKKYGRVDFFDDDQANIDAAKMVRGVDARKVAVRKNLGGIVQKFAQKTFTPNGGLVESLSSVDQKVLDDLRAKFGADNVTLTAKGIRIQNSGFEGLSRATKVGGVGSEIVVPFKEFGKKNFVPFKKRKGSTYSSAQEQVISSILSARNQYIQQRESSATESKAASLAEQQALVERVKKTGKKGVIVGLRGDTKEIADRSLFTATPDATIKLDNKIKKRISGFETEIVRGALPTDLATIITKDIKQTIKLLVGRIGTTISQRAGVTGTKGDRSIGRVVKKQMAQFEGLAFETGLAIANLNAGGRYNPKWNSMDFAMGLEKDIADVFGVPANVAADAARQATQETARKKVKSGQITRGLGPGGEVAMIRQKIATTVARQQRVRSRAGTKVQSKASGGEIKGIRSSLAREAILGRQLNGVEMIKAARRAGYDIEELDNGQLQLSRNNKPMHTGSRAEISKLLGSISTGYNLGGSIQKFASGGSPEDTVPALLTPGEFVINKRAAKRLGSSKLNRLNRADRISGFNSGGAVGNVPSYSSGGDVQRFFFGGGARARPGTEATSQNLMISGNVMTQLREITTALQELGVASSNSADLVRRGGRISVQAANAAYEADILRMRVAGAPMQAVIEAETRLANMRQQAQTQIRAQRQLSGVGGAQLENIDAAAQQRLQQLVARRQASGLEVDEAFMQRAEGAAYTRAARQQGLAPAQTAGLTGNDLRQYINSAMGDPRTFEQMNRQFEARRRQELDRQYRDELSAGGTRTLTNREIRQSQQRAARDAKAEADLRRQTLNQTRGAAGPGAARGERMQQGMFMASFAIPMLAQMVAGDPSQAGSAGGAAMSAGIQGGANTIAMGTMIASMFPPGLGQGLAFAATAAAAVGQAFIDAKNATIEFEKNLAAKKIEFALEDTSKLFDKLAKDIKDIDVQNAIGQKLIEASVAAQSSIEMQATTAKAFWVNMFDSFDTFGSNAAAGETGRESVQRSQILEKFGTSAYLSTTQFGQGLMGGSGSAQERASQARTSYINQMIPEQSRELSKQFAPIADNSIKLIEEKIRGGLNIEEYLNTDEFKKLSTAIALSNTAVSEQVLRIRNSTVLSDAQKAAQERLIISTAAEEEARRRASIAAREIQLREVQKATNQLSRSLERMFQNMEQAINKTNFGLEKMARDLDLVSSSLTGQAKAGEGAIKAINILQNPRAYGSAEVGAARSQAAGFFGGSSDIVKGLLTLGDDIEATIMGTINRTVKETEGDSPAKIAIAIEKSVKDKLQSLELPPDVAEKLAREVKVALNEIRKEGDEKADFTQIEEKLKDLGRILDSTRRAQEVALKVLENWQSSLNSYTSSINSLTDLQIDFQSRLRKSSELVIDSQNNLAKTLGKDISIETLVGNRNALIRQQTGGVAAPGDIFRNINRLEAQRRQQEGAVDVARQGGPGRMKDFMIMSNNLKLTNVALRENYDALRNLAENSNIAAAALNKIQEAQQRQQGKVGFIEKLVTSTPEEFESLNRAFIRLQNNANGQINTINNSVGAQKAYIEAIQGGATAMEAMRAAQTAFANERRDTLSALNDLLPFLGGGQQANQIRANTLESMLMESGMGVSPMFQEVLNALRNPELDPETQRAIALYQEANQLQVTANNFLNQINNKLQEETADKAAKAIALALTNTILTFKNAEQGDLNRGVVPQNRATGGIIYASNGAFAPRGTDTVPAMLTPGEFVVNKNATAKNLPLLKSINSQKFSGGGKVKYYADGGLVSSYLSKNARTREDFQSSKEEFLDPSDPQLNILLGNGAVAEGSKKLQMLPNAWYREPDGNVLQTPDRNADFGKLTRVFVPEDAKFDIDLSKLYPKNGKILPGAVSFALETDKLSSSVTTGIKVKDMGVHDLVPSVLPGSEKSIIFGIDNDRSVQFKTKQIKKSEFKSYKDNIRKIKDKYASISWIQNRASPISRALYNADEYPSNVTPIQNSADKFNPNGMEGNSVLYYGNELSAFPKQYGYIWKWINERFGETFGVNPDVATVSSSTTKPTFEKASEFSFKEKTPITALGPKGFEPNSPGIIKPNEVAAILDYHQNQFQTIRDAIVLADNDFKNIKFTDTEDIKRYLELQNQLSNLYNNISPYEEFKDLSLFHKSFLRNATSLVVASDTASSRDEIAKYVENLQGRLAPGEKPRAGGGPIVVGLSKPLEGNLNDLTKDWVRKSEFDIFSDKGVGNVKNFPFLVNADMANLEGFKERANQALLEKQEQIIQQRGATGNGKFSIDLRAGEKIDVPYSATYTKYSGPLWDAVAKTFSEDPAKQLKDIFLADSAPNTIFSKLDTTNQRLFNTANPFDIDTFADQKINLGSITRLIDLVKTDGAANLIDQVKNNIIKNSELIFPHINGAGSLIKFPNSAGQEIFSAYSQLPSTRLNIGEFLVDAVMDYAKQAKQQAGEAAGKVADQKLGQEVIGDAPMETVRVLQQLSQGALQVFGRRPVPGLPRGWLFNNIRSLQGILPRGGRTSIGRLANNDQAKAAASIIRNVISNAGAYVSNVAGRTNNPQLYSGLKDTYGLMSGAYKAFDSISKSDTRQLAQLLGGNADAESIFRTLGASASFQRAAASSLSEDYKAILGNQLSGSKITTVNADGSITRVNPADAPPPKVENYSDLMNLALNPYNEFSSRVIRSGIFDKLIADISTAVDNRGMPYFEPNTSNFLISSLDSLKKWYGGDGAWLGQDYLFDKGANADPANRGQQFLQNLDAGRGLYEMANMAHRNLGGSVKYGDLPGDIWLKNRVEAGNFATGGMVYAAGGTLVNFQPRGTDTVPAMLTPGEFVVNRAATQKHLPLLKSINSNTYMAEGGLLEPSKMVQGVKIPGRDNLSPRINRIDKNIGINTTSIQAIDKNIASIQDSMDKLSSGQKMLTGSLDSLKDLQKQILVIADMVMKSPQAIYDQVLVTLRQLWNQIGNALTATLQGLMNAPWPAAPFNNGGPVYASKGQLINFQPKGTDTVPAMLTPGEFVVNRSATQKNLPLLKSINSGVGGYSSGGVVYLQDGGAVSGKPVPSDRFKKLTPQEAKRASQLGIAHRRGDEFFDTNGMGISELAYRTLPETAFLPRKDDASSKNQLISGLYSEDPFRVAASRRQLDTQAREQAFGEMVAFSSSAGKSVAPTIVAAEVGTATIGATAPFLGPFSIIPGFITGTLAGLATAFTQNTILEGLAPAASDYLNKMEQQYTGGAMLGGTSTGIGMAGQSVLSSSLGARFVSGGLSVATNRATNSFLYGSEVGPVDDITALAIGFAAPGGPPSRLNRSLGIRPKDMLQVLRDTPLVLTDDSGIPLPLRQQRRQTQTLAERSEYLRRLIQENATNNEAVLAKGTLGSYSRFDDAIFMRESHYGTPLGRDILRHEWLHALVASDVDAGPIIEKIRLLKDQYHSNPSLLGGARSLFSEEKLAFDTAKYSSQSRMIPVLERLTGGVLPIKLGYADQVISRYLFDRLLYNDSKKRKAQLRSRREQQNIQKQEAILLKFLQDLQLDAKKLEAEPTEVFDSIRYKDLGDGLEMLESAPEISYAPKLSDFGTRIPQAPDVDAAHGTGAGMMSVDPSKLVQGMLGEGFYVGLKAEEAPITYLRMGIDKWLRTNNLTQGNVTPEQIAQFPGGIYPVTIRGGIDDFIAADQILRENPTALAKVQSIYNDLGLSRTSLGPIEYRNDPITGRPKPSRSQTPFDVESATMMEVYDNIQNQLAAKYEASFAGKSNIPDPRAEALDLSARDMRTMFVKYGIPGITDLNNARGQGSMAAIFDLDRISLGKAYIPDEVLKEVLGYDDIAEAKRQIEFIKTGKYPEAETAITKNRGGLIYASKGQLINFQPKGTDTVPAMLTPGEFVVNRSATQKNLPLLKAINNGVGGYSRGGVVYLQRGGQTLAPAPVRKPMSDKEFADRIKSAKEITDWIHNNAGTEALVRAVEETKLLRKLGIRIGGKIGGRLLSKLLPVIGPAIGATFGGYDAYQKGENIFKGALLSAITGDATSGSIASGLFGIEAGSIADKTMGVIGAMINGALAGGGAGLLTGGIASLPAAILGTFVAGATEFYKIYSEKQLADQKTRDEESYRAIFELGLPPRRRRPFIDDNDTAPARPRPESQNIAPVRPRPESQNIAPVRPRPESQNIAPARPRPIIRKNPPISLEPRSKGGLIYASKGQLINFQPKGTDTVPAMLTPGEFVVNRAATQKNLPLLKAINNGVGGYSDGGVVYLQAGGRPQAGQMPRRGPRDKDEVEAYKRGGLRDRLRAQSDNRFDTQQQSAQKNQQGRLWIFTVPENAMIKGKDGKPLNNGLQFLLKGANGSPTANLTTESLAAMDISKVFSLRSNSPANALKAFNDTIKNQNDQMGIALMNPKPVDAIGAINKTRNQQARKSFDQRILDELSYQIQTNKDIFSVFNPGFFNIEAGVIDKYTKEMNDIIDNMDLNNPASVMAGMAALGPKVNKVKTRRDYLEEIIRNNQQALAVLRAANLDPKDSANQREAFGNFLPTEIHDAQIVNGNKELTSAKKILENLGLNPKVQLGLRNPLVAQAFQRLLLPTGGFGVPVSTFEGGAGGVAIPQKLARGGMIYANNGQLINFQSRGSDTVPAMLTPGEFVVNRQSAQNNLPLLQAINSGLYNRGGRVSYLAGGTPGTEELYKSLANFSQIITAGAESIRKVLDNIASRLDESSNRSQNITQTNNGVSNNSNPAAVVDALGNRLDRFIEQLQNALPPFIRVEGQHQVNVVINGGAILQQLLSGPIGNIVQNAIQDAFNKRSRKNEGF